MKSLLERPTALPLASLMAVGQVASFAINTVDVFHVRNYLLNARHYRGS